MKKYNKPVVSLVDSIAEGVYLASGVEEPTKKNRCRFGRVEANAGSDSCQACSVSGGQRNKELPGESLYKADFKSCIDNMPIK